MGCLGGASRGSGEPGGAHAGILPGGPGFGHSGQNDRGRDGGDGGERKGRTMEKRKRKGGGNGEEDANGQKKAHEAADLCIQEIDFMASNRRR